MQAGKQSLNSLCNCGSGKKYKRCCGLSNSGNSGAKSLFAKFNSDELLKIFAGLSTSSANHGKNIRLDTLTAKTLLSYNNKAAKPTQRDIETFFKGNYRFESQEDPAVNLFTDRIPFYGGDKLVFPGISSDGPLILNTLLDAIFQSAPGVLPHEYVSNCNHAVHLLLLLSDRVVKHAGYPRYLTGNAASQDIEVPSQETLEQLASAVTISAEEMEQILATNGIAKEVLNEFLITTKAPGLSAVDVLDNPVLLKPIFFTGSQYIICSPTNICYTLIDWLWTYADSWKCSKDLNAVYHVNAWHRCNMYLRQIGFEFLPDQPTIEMTSDEPIYWGVYRFDDDKLAFIEYAFDDGKNYASNNIGKFNSKGALKLKKQVLDILRADTRYSQYEFLDLVIIANIGRMFSVHTEKVAGVRTLTMPSSELEIIAQINEDDAIDLWKYAIAREETMPHTGVMFSFLDAFKLYKDHNESFYLSDEHRFNWMAVDIGYGEISMRQKLAENCDIHSARFLNAGRPAYKTVQKVTEYAPIYASREDAANGILDFLVAGYAEPIWVMPNEALYNGKARDIRRTLYWFTDAISYWLWQVTPYIRERVDAVLAGPTIITFNIAKPEDFESLDGPSSKVEDLRKEFSVSKTDNGFEILIPSAIIPYLNSADNEGERIMLEFLIKGFDLLRSRAESIFGYEELAQVINSAAPLGQKKKIFILNTADNALMAQANLVKHRYVQEYDTSIVLDTFLPQMGASSPPVGPLPDLASKSSLARKVVGGSLKLLTDKINQYNCEDLLKRLIALNESLIHKKEDMKITAPTRLACYLSSGQMVQDLRESQQSVNRSVISVRCLIEHVAAEQVVGSKPVSVCGIDELVAIMDSILTWGTLGDQLNYELFDIGMSILPTGRIGTEKKEFREIFDPYFNSKTEEDLTDAIKLFERNFLNVEDYAESDFPENIDNAFKADYGISFLRLCYFIDSLAEIGVRQADSYCHLPVTELFDAINEVSEEPFEQVEFDAAIGYITLGYRTKVTNRPEGCDNNDISPWRFNRQLSLLRKPLVKIEYPGISVPTYYWGFREALITKRYIFEGLQSGRLKVKEGGKLSKVVGKLANERGDSLVDRVKGFFEKDTTLIVDIDVTIGPHGVLKFSEDIGDIDCLIIDQSRKAIFSLECKNMATSRNVKEMVEELGKLFGSDSEKGWIAKHQVRDEWLKDNVDLLSAEYGIDLTDYSITSVFVTRESMLSPHLKKDIPIPFVTLYDLEQKGLSAFPAS